MSCEHMNLTVRQEELGMHNAWAHVCGGAPFHHAKHGLSVPVLTGVCPLKHGEVSADVCLQDHCGSCTKEQCTEQRQEADSVERLHRPHGCTCSQVNKQLRGLALQLVIPSRKV